MTLPLGTERDLYVWMHTCKVAVAEGSVPWEQ